MLQGNNYRKTCKRSPRLPKVNSEIEALEALQSLQWVDIIINVKNIPRPEEPTYQGILWKKPAPTPIVPLIGGEAFVWADIPTEKPQRRRWMICLLHIFVILALFASRKYLMESPLRIFLRHVGTFWRINLTLSFGSLVDIIICLLASPFIIVFVRTPLFVTTHMFCSPGLWLFPNLFTDPTFFGPFFPLYAWDTNPKECLGLRWRRFRNSILGDLGMLKRRRVNRTRRISPRTLRVK